MSSYTKMQLYTNSLRLTPDDTVLFSSVITLSVMAESLSISNRGFFLTGAQTSSSSTVLYQRMGLYK